MILGLERLDRITMFIDEVASMPLGGGRGLSGRLDSRELSHHVAAAAHSVVSQHSNLGPRGDDEEVQRRQGTAVEQLRSMPGGPSPLGGRSSMPQLHVAALPSITTKLPPSESAFPLNPHQSYDEEWGTRGGSGGHDSSDDVFVTPHAPVGHSNGGFGSAATPNCSPKQQLPGTAPSNRFAADQSQFPYKSPATAATGGQLPLQPHRPAPEPPHRRLDLSPSASAPVGPDTGPPNTPEQPHPTTSDKLYSPQHQGQQNLQQRSPSSLLSRASARIRVALEASEATIKAGPADPPPRLPGLPPSSGHRRTYSQQVAAMCIPAHAHHHVPLSLYSCFVEVNDRTGQSCMPRPYQQSASNATLHQGKAAAAGPKVSFRCFQLIAVGIQTCQTPQQ